MSNKGLFGDGGGGGGGGENKAEDEKKEAGSNFSFVQLHGLIKFFERECDKEENSERSSLRGGKEVESGVKICLPLLEAFSYVCENPFSRQMSFNPSAGDHRSSAEGAHGLSAISQSGYAQLCSSWKATDGNRAGLTPDDFFCLEQRMMLKSLERLLRLIAKYGDNAFMRRIKQAFSFGGSGPMNYSPLKRIYARAFELFSLVDDSGLRLSLAQILFLAKVVLNDSPENDSNEFPKEICHLLSGMQRSKAAGSDEDYETSVFLLFAILSDILNERCGIKRANSYVRESTEGGEVTLHGWVITYVVSDLIQCYCKASSGNLFSSNVVSFPFLTTSLERLLERKNKNVQLLQIVAYTYLSRELGELRRGDRDHDTMAIVAYDLACVCARGNPCVRESLLGSSKRSIPKASRGLFAAYSDLNGLKLFVEAGVPFGVISGDYEYLLGNVRTACSQAPLELDNGKMDLLLHFFNSLSSTAHILRIFKGDLAPFEAFLDACIEKLETVLLRDKAGAQCLKDLVELVAKVEVQEQQSSLLDSLLCFNDGTPWAAAAVSVLLSGKSAIMPDKDLFYKFVHRNLASVIGSNASLGEETACVTLKLIDVLLKDDKRKSFVLSEKESLTRLFQSIISHSNVTYFMSSKQRKITSLCIRLINLIQTQKFRSSYVNFIFKEIIVSCFEVLEKICKEYQPGAEKPPGKLFMQHCGLLQKLISNKMLQLKYTDKSVIVAILRFLTSLQLASESLFTYKILSYTRENPTIALIVDYVKQQSESDKFDEISFDAVWLLVTLEASNELQSYPWYYKNEDSVIAALEQKLISFWGDPEEMDSSIREQECILSFLLVVTTQKKSFTTKERVDSLISNVGKPLRVFSTKYSKAAQDAATLVACLFSCGDKALFSPKHVSVFLASLCGFLNILARKLHAVSPEAYSPFFYFVSQVVSAVHLRKIIPSVPSDHGFSAAVLNILEAAAGASPSVAWDPEFLALVSAALQFDADGAMKKEILLKLSSELVGICRSGNNSGGAQGRVSSVLRLFLILGDLMGERDPRVVEKAQEILFTDGAVVEMALRTLCYLVEGHRDLRSARWVLHFLNSALLRNTGAFFLVVHLLRYFDSVAVVFNALFRLPTPPGDAAAAASADPDGLGGPVPGDLRLQALSLLTNVVAAYGAHRGRLQRAPGAPEGDGDAEALARLLGPLTAESGGLAAFARKYLRGATERSRFAEVVLAFARCFHGAQRLRRQVFLYVCDGPLDDLWAALAARQQQQQPPNKEKVEKVAEAEVVSCARTALLALCEMLPPLELLDNVAEECFVPDEERGRPTFERLNYLGGRFACLVGAAVRDLDEGAACNEPAGQKVDVVTLLVIVYAVVVGVQVKMIELRTDRIQRQELKTFVQGVGNVSRMLGGENGFLSGSESSVALGRIVMNLFRKAEILVGELVK